MARAFISFGIALLLAGSASAAARRVEVGQQQASRLDGCVRAGSNTALVRFRAGAGDLLRAAVLGHGKAGVVLSNQSDRDLCAWLPFARVLEKAGYRVLLYDYARLDPWVELAAAARQLRRLGARRIFLIGASEGAKASIMAGSRARTPATAVVSLSAERYILGNHDVKLWAAKLTRPILFITARRDPYSSADTPILYRACPAREKKLVTVEGNAHGIDLLTGATAKEVRSDILTFLRQHK